MINNVKVHIVCPCGELIDTKTVNANTSGIKRGEATCRVCKRKVAYSISGGQAFTSYK